MSAYRRRMPRSITALLLVLAACAAGCASAPLPQPLPFDAAADATSDRFLVLGDSRHGFAVVEFGDEPTRAERLEYAEALRDERPAFVVHAGDIARTGAEEEDWVDFDVDFAPLREGGVAMYPALGNHEYRGPNDRALANYFARFPDLSRRHFYARNFRGVRLLFLDSNVEDLGQPRTKRQMAWLRSRLEESHADDEVRAVFLVAHHPPYSNRIRPGESRWMRTKVLPLAGQYPKVRALFVGHVHSYEHFDVDGIHSIVTGGGGSPLHSLRPAHHEGARPDLYDGPRGFHYLRVLVGARITIEVVMRDDAGGWFLADRFDV